MYKAVYFIFFCQLLLQEDNLGVEYEYNMPLVVEEDLSLEEEDFGWKYLPWSECSATCSTGNFLHRKYNAIYTLQYEFIMYRFTKHNTNLQSAT